MIKKKHKQTFPAFHSPRRSHRRHFAADYKVKAVRLHLGKGISLSAIAGQIGIRNVTSCTAAIATLEAPDEGEVPDEVHPSWSDSIGICM